VIRTTKNNSIETNKPSPAQLNERLVKGSVNIVPRHTYDQSNRHDDCTTPNEPTTCCQSVGNNSSVGENDVGNKSCQSRRQNVRTLTNDDCTVVRIISRRSSALADFLDYCVLYSVVRFGVARTARYCAISAGEFVQYVLLVSAD
jgi:hypothetical protein